MGANSGTLAASTRTVHSGDKGLPTLVGSQDGSQQGDHPECDGKREASQLLAQQVRGLTAQQAADASAAAWEMVQAHRRQQAERKKDVPPTKAKAAKQVEAEALGGRPRGPLLVKLAGLALGSQSQASMTQQAERAAPILSR